MNFPKYTQTNKKELFPPTAGITFIGEKYKKKEEGCVNTTFFKI
jgi:hypothetical protein